MKTRLRYLFALTLVLICGATARIEAAAPTNQAPGFFRYAVGDFVVTALQDGVISLPASGAGYQGLDQKQMEALIARAFLLKGTSVQTSVNAYLVDTGTHRILVDAGNASCYGWTLGGLPANLKAAGYTLEQIDVIVITHLHGDHVCGLTMDGKRVFPNATVWAAKEEAAYWLEGSGRDQSRKMVSDALAPYGRDFRTFAATDVIVPGMRIIPAPGHTPGHTAFLFESKGASLLAFGDIVHCHPVQFPHPEVSIGSDADRKQAVATREALFERTAKDGTLIAGSHLPFPGLGHIRKEANGYGWVPVEFGPIEK